jgi:hypothetical protein
MQLAALIALLTLAAPAGPAPAEKARVTILILSAKPGDNRDGEGVDPRLAAKLRVSLQQLGMEKPDLDSLVKPVTRVVGSGEAAAAASGGAGVEATCKSAGDDGVTLSVALFTEVKEGRKTVRRYSDPTVVKFSKPGKVQSFVQPEGKGVRICVVSAVREGDAQKGGGDAPKDRK